MDIYVLIVWIVIAIFLFNIKSEKDRYKYKDEKAKVVLIITMLYYVIYFLLGLKTGYSNTPYSQKFTQLFKNLMFIVVLRIVQEYVRTKSLNKFENIYWYVFITIIFAVFQMNFEELANITGRDELFKYILSVVLQIFIESALLTYLSINGGYILNLCYILPNLLITIISPIFPELDWFLSSVLLYVRIILTFIFINYEDIVKMRLTRRELRKESPFKSIVSISFVIVVVCFVTGLFPYRPVAIISNSMYPVFSRGDVCIIKNINPENMYEIKPGDIIEYSLNNIHVIHRVIEIHEELTKTTYITKGDNNNMQDTLPVEEEQITGIVVRTIKYLGFPSVWFSERFLLR